mgnify:CR=1 FL=1
MWLREWAGADAATLELCAPTGNAGLQRFLDELNDLDADQRTRLAAALTRLQGRQVRVNVIVDPEVVGGIVVRVGDDVIDGSVSARLEQARRAVSA